MDDNFYEKFSKINIKGLPKYALLREVLRKAIKSGHWKAGAQLPSETDIARTSNFSLGTVQRSLNELVEEGILLRSHGKGTFVKEMKKQMIDPWHCRFISAEDGNFLPIYPKVVLRKRITSTAKWSAFINSIDTNIIQIDRTINVDNKFVIYSKLLLFGNKFEVFLTRPIEEFEHIKIKNILYQELNISIANISYFIKMEHFPNKICKAIGVDKNTVGLLYKNVASSNKNKPVYYQEIYIPPIDYDLFISDLSDIPKYWT